MDARIDHLTILSEDNYALGRFYQGIFHMRALETESPTDGVSLSDGHIGLDIRPRLPGYRAQLDTFSIALDDLPAARAHLAEMYPAISCLDDPAVKPFAAVTTHDPDGNVFHLSQSAPGTGGNAKGQDRAIDHIALRVLHPERVAEFYTSVFGFSAIDGPSETGNIYLSDGHVTLAIIPWTLDDFEGTGITARGMDHIGFRVEGIAALKADIQRITDRNYRFQPPTSTLGRGNEGSGRLAMFRRTCPLGHYHLSDSDGLLLDVTE